MIKTAITGSTGLIGSRIIELLRQDIDFLEILQSDTDITNKESIWNFLKDKNYHILLHLAGYTNVDGAEKEQDLAYKVNVEGTRNIFEVVQEQKKKLIYISTDFVFDGINPPYDENSTPNPLGVYAKTKYEGEKILNGDAMIVRIAYPYRAAYKPKKDFVRSLKSLLEQQKELHMITDASITPTFIDDIAYTLKYLINNYSPEVFHVVGASSHSPFAAAKLIAQTFRLDESLVKPTTFAQYSAGKAPRSQYSEIKSIKNTFYRMKTLEEGLNAMRLHYK